MANFLVAVAYNKGVVLCKHYPWTVTGERFAEFVSHCFPQVFAKCEVQPQGRLFLQDGDPWQTSKIAKDAWERLGCKMFSIPARSPDLNPIENIFHLVRQQLKNDALEKGITRESYDTFIKRVAKTISEFPVETINKTIESMGRQINMVIKNKGCRTKY